MTPCHFTFNKVPQSSTRGCLRLGEGLGTRSDNSLGCYNTPCSAASGCFAERGTALGGMPSGCSDPPSATATRRSGFAVQRASRRGLLGRAIGSVLEQKLGLERNRATENEAIECLDNRSLVIGNGSARNRRTWNQPTSNRADVPLDSPGTLPPTSRRSSSVMAKQGEHLRSIASAPIPPEDACNQALDSDLVLVVLSTAPVEEAQTLARTLVEEGLVACVNLVPGVESIYTWRGEVRKDAEVLLLMKTTQSKFDSLEARFVGLHSYDVPELLALPVGRGLPAYLDWIATALAPGDTAG